MSDDVRTYLALAVQHLMVERGMSSAELAAAIGARHQDLSRRLSGDIPIENRDVPRLAAGLGVPPQELIDRALDLHQRSSREGLRARIREILDSD